MPQKKLGDAGKRRRAEVPAMRAGDHAQSSTTRPPEGARVGDPSWVVWAERRVAELVAADLGRPEGAAPAQPASPDAQRQGGNLDTLRLAPERAETVGESGGGVWSLCRRGPLPGGQLALSIEPAQLGIDGAPYAIPAPLPSLTHPWPAPEPRTALPHVAPRVRDQLAFEFAAGGDDAAGCVQLSIEDWIAEKSRALAWLGDHEHAQRQARCGSMIQIRRCTGCGEHDLGTVQRSALCDLRTCPRCERKRAQAARSRLTTLTRVHPGRRRGPTWIMHTLTIRRPRGTTIARLRRDASTALQAWGAGAWPMLRRWGATHAYVHGVEVSPGGMIHVHALVRGPRLSRGMLARVRACVIARGAGAFYNLRPVDRLKNAIRETAKYVTKGVSRSDAGATQTHPLLAAMVDRALAGMRLRREYGDWALADAAEGARAESPAERWSCPTCGHGHAGTAYHAIGALGALRVRAAALARPPDDAPPWLTGWWSHTLTDLVAAPAWSAEGRAARARVAEFVAFRAANWGLTAPADVLT